MADKLVSTWLSLRELLMTPYSTSWRTKRCCICLKAYCQGNEMTLLQYHIIPSIITARFIITLGVDQTVVACLFNTCKSNEEQDMSRGLCAYLRERKRLVKVIDLLSHQLLLYEVWT